MLLSPAPSMPHSLTGLPVFWFSRTILSRWWRRRAVLVVASDVVAKLVAGFCAATAVVIGPLRVAIWVFDGPAAAVRPPGEGGGGGHRRAAAVAGQLPFDDRSCSPHFEDAGRAVQ